MKYVPEPEDSILQHTALKIYRQFHQFPHALRVAMMLNDPALIKEVFLQCPDRSVVPARVIPGLQPRAGGATGRGKYDRKLSLLMSMADIVCSACAAWPCGCPGVWAEGSTCMYAGLILRLLGTEY